MPNTTSYDLMDRDELVRLAGEQALLKQEMSTYSAEQNRDLGVLRNLANDVSHNQNWHERGVQLLDRLRDRQLKIADAHRRLSELSKLTGIN